MKDKIKELKEELEKLEERIIDAINKIDTNEPNDKLIELISLYPEQKDIIKFIVDVNDNFLRNHLKSREIIIDALSALIEHKKRLLLIIEGLHGQKKITIISTLKDLPKYAWFSITALIIAILLFIFLDKHPDKTDVIIKSITHTKQLKDKK